MKRLIALLVSILTIAACSPTEVAETTTTTTTAPTTTTTTTDRPMSVTSPAFEPDGAIPVKFTCDGDDVNPRLEVSDLPELASYLVVVVDDPDAPLGTWVHWLEYDIPVDGTSYIIEEDSGPIGVRGVNSWNLLGYGGPCPPPGETHRYFFKVFALSGPLGLPEGADTGVVDEAIDRKSVV